MKVRATTFTMSLAAEPRVQRDGDRTAGASEDVRNSHACHAKLRASPSEAKLRGVLQRRPRISFDILAPWSPFPFCADDDIGPGTTTGIAAPHEKDGRSEQLCGICCVYKRAHPVADAAKSQYIRNSIDLLLRSASGGPCVTTRAQERRMVKFVSPS